MMKTYRLFPVFKGMSGEYTGLASGKVVPTDEDDLDRRVKEYAERTGAVRVKVVEV